MFHVLIFVYYIKMKLTAIDLFTGCGGAALGLRHVCKIVAYCDSNPDCRRVIQKNQDLGHLDVAPIYEDVRTFPSIKQNIDLVSAGFPCQDISQFGNKEGLDGTRSSLFHSAMHVIRIHNPMYVFLENVENILKMPNVWKTVISELDDADYDASWFVLGAGNVGAPHRRNRWFLVGIKRGCKLPCSEKNEWKKFFTDTAWNMQNGFKARPDRLWEVDEDRVIDDGKCKATEARLMQCGNICVPKQAAAAFSLLRFGLVYEQTGTIHDGDVMPTWGYMTDGIIYGVVPRVLPYAKNLDLAFKQYPRPPGRHRSERTLLDTISSEIHRSRFATPRALGGNSACWTLTRRGMSDIANQLRYERNTNNRWKRYPNPVWVEWMVGLPKNWTI